MKCLWGNESERERERETKENEYLDGDKNQGNVISDLKICLEFKSIKIY